MTSSDAETDFKSVIIIIITISNINDFTKLIGVSYMPVQLKQEIISTVLKSSFAFYSNRNNAAMIDDA